MGSMATDIADALAAGISAYTFSAPYQSVQAVRRYVPDDDSTDVRSLKISVVPGPVQTEKTSRAQDLFTHDVAIVVVKGVDGSNAAIDALMKLCEEIIDAVRSGLLDMPTLPENALYFASSMETTFDRDSLNNHRLFMAQLMVTFRVPRPFVAAPTGA